MKYPFFRAAILAVSFLPGCGWYDQVPAAAGGAGGAGGAALAGAPSSAGSSSAGASSGGSSSAGAPGGGSSGAGAPGGGSSNAGAPNGGSSSAGAPGGGSSNAGAPSGGSTLSDRPRVIVSSDIGGSDNDDYQSMAHILTYADLFELEGFVSSPWGAGRVSHYLEAIAAYEKDYPNLKTYSDNYPTPEALRAMSKQGAIDSHGATGFATSTEGSQWIIDAAHRADPRPLWLLIWGGIDDLAQVLHDAPDVVDKLRVYWIGGPNKRYSTPAYDYIRANHQKLWIIESNTTYRGFFNGGDTSGDLSNSLFASKHVRGHGALGAYFWAKRPEIKMGDTPSVLYLLNNQVDDPTKPGWGGKYMPLAGYSTWWTDDPAPALVENGYPGAKTINIWRKEFLMDWQPRMDRCQAPKP